LSDQDFVVSIIKNACQISLAAVSTRLLTRALDFLSTASGAATPLLASEQASQYCHQPETYAFEDLLVTRLCSFEVAITADVCHILQTSSGGELPTVRRGADNADS